MRSSSLFVVSIIVLALLSSCRKNRVEVVQDDSPRYFPIEVGYRWFYQYDSIAYNGNFGTDSFDFEQRHQVVQRLEDIGDQPTYRVEVHNRIGSQWQFDRNYFLSVGPNEVLRTDQDATVIILSMPFLRFKTWDGHQYSSEPEAEFYLESLYAPHALNDTTYDPTVTVIHDIEVNLVNSLEGQEVFARDVGLVYRMKDRRLNVLSPSQTTGYTLYQQLIRFED